jgi:hypothetical protein
MRLSAGLGLRSMASFPASGTPFDGNVETSQGRTIDQR